MNFIQRALRNWRTTAMGAGSILTGVGDLLSQLGNWRLEPEQLGPDAMAIFIGLGLLFARDSAVSEHDHKVEKVEREVLADKVEENRAILADQVQEQIKEIR